MSAAKVRITANCDDAKDNKTPDERRRLILDLDLKRAYLGYDDAELEVSLEHPGSLSNLPHDA